MESEQHHYELRSSRSRSQTPLVQNRALIESELIEHHYDLRNKSRERSHTPSEVTSSRRSGSRSLPGSASKTRDKSMETIVEGKDEVTVDATLETHSKRSESSMSNAIKKAERRSERQRAKRQTFANGQNEAKASSFERKEEQKRRSASPRKILTSDYSSEEGEREDPPSRPGSAYEIYKQVGEWWNVFPKTDYTYSQASQCRYEIAPGILAMPNMSRRSIHSDGSSTISSVPSTSQPNLSQCSQVTAESGFGTDTVDVDELREMSSQQLGTIDDSYKPSRQMRSSDSMAHSMIFKKTHVEEYKSHKEVIYGAPGSTTSITQRCFSWSTPSQFTDSRKFSSTPQVDSDTELDDAVTVSTKRYNQRWKVTQWVTSLTTIITVSFIKMLEFAKLRTPKRREYHTTYEYQRYYGEPKWHRLRRYIGHSLQYVYLFMVKIFLFDSWLLSQISSIRKWIQQKGPKVLWITLLPLLLLGGIWGLPYLVSLFPATKVAIQEVSEVLSSTISTHVNNNKDKSIRNSFIGIGDLKVIMQNLNDRVEKLESGSTYQKDYLSNVSFILQEMKKNDFDVWQQYNTKIMALEQKLEKEATNNINDHALDAIKVEFNTLKQLYSELKFCCSMRADVFATETIEKHVEKVIAEYFGAEISKEDLARIIQGLITLRGAEAHISKVNINNDVESSEMDEHIRKIVKDILKIYDADKTARVDYALESVGGQIISTRCTQRYDTMSRAFKILGFTFYHDNNNPQTVIQGNPIKPGTCWAFQDFPGYLLIKLRNSIYVTGFTVEHAPKSILPNGEMRSAPRKFNVWGLVDENDPEPVMLGDYEFLASDENLQYFPVQNTAIATPYEYIELRVHSNHGQLEYTCMYRFRVHGRPA
ncbi:hypothetical protein KM043_014156 [Ampulex compressa]|nr:hypothetical protein KM043_014156 [Ampulex compressa]